MKDPQLLTSHDAAALVAEVRVITRYQDDISTMSQFGDMIARARAAVRSDGGTLPLLYIDIGRAMVSWGMDGR